MNVINFQIRGIDVAIYQPIVLFQDVNLNIKHQIRDYS